MTITVNLEMNFTVLYEGGREIFCSNMPQKSDTVPLLLMEKGRKKNNSAYTCVYQGIFDHSFFKAHVIILH